MPPHLLVDQAGPETVPSLEALLPLPLDLVEVGLDKPIQGCRSRIPDPIPGRTGFVHSDARRLLQRKRVSPACSRSRQRSTAPAREIPHNSFLPIKILIEPRSRISESRAGIDSRGRRQSKQSRMLMILGRPFSFVCPHVGLASDGRNVPWRRCHPEPAGGALKYLAPVDSIELLRRVSFTFHAGIFRKMLSVVVSQTKMHR